MTEMLARMYSSKSTQRELSNGYQHDRVQIIKESLHCCALEKSSLSIGRVKGCTNHNSGRSLHRATTETDYSLHSWIYIQLELTQPMNG